MHGNQWVLKIAVLKYYSVSKRGTTAKSNPKQATDPISLHTKFGDNSSNTFPLNERKPCVTPDIGRRTSDGEKSKNNISTPQGGGHNTDQCEPCWSLCCLYFTLLSELEGALLFILPRFILTFTKFSNHRRPLNIIDPEAYLVFSTHLRLLKKMDREVSLGFNTHIRLLKTRS